MADRGRKALPVDNRLCNDRWVDYCQKLHRERLSTMRSTASYPRLKTLDNRAPETMNMPHLQLRQKKVQKEEERYQEIELENRKLLEKMSKIMKQNPSQDRAANGGGHSTPFLYRSTLHIKHGIVLDKNQYPIINSLNVVEFRSLNREYRLRELQRITLENQAMLERIQRCAPYYDREKWEESHAREVGYANNIRSREYLSRSRLLSPQRSMDHHPLAGESLPRIGTAPA